MIELVCCSSFAIRNLSCASEWLGFKTCLAEVMWHLFCSISWFRTCMLITGGCMDLYVPRINECNSELVNRMVTAAKRRLDSGKLTSFGYVQCILFM